MYHAIVRHRIAVLFERLSTGRWRDLVAIMTPDITYQFALGTTLGGTHRGVDAVTAWFERLNRLLPGAVFHVRTITSAGSPWNTRVAVEWANESTLVDGTPYANRGVHVVRIRLGRIQSIREYLGEPEALVDALNRTAAAGTAEASAPPLP